MIKKHLPRLSRKSRLTFLAIALGIGLMMFSNLRLNRRITTLAQSRPATKAQANMLPEHVPYMFLFHHLVFLKQKVDEFERQGKGRSSLLTRFQEEAGLTPGEFQQLYQVASDCEKDLAAQDQKAMAIINEMKAPYPDGKLPAGQAPPSIPPELSRLQQERDSTVLQARDRLHLALGELTFLQFHAFVKARVGSEIKPGITH